MRLRSLAKLVCELFFSQRNVKSGRRQLCQKIKQVSSLTTSADKNCHLSSSDGKRTVIPLKPPVDCKPGDRVVIKGYEHETAGGTDLLTQWRLFICSYFYCSYYLPCHNVVVSVQGAQAVDKINKTTTLHVHHVFLYISQSSLRATTTGKCLISGFVGDVNKRQRLPFSFPVLRYGLLDRIQLQKKIANI